MVIDGISDPKRQTGHALRSNTLSRLAVLRRKLRHRRRSGRRGGTAVEFALIAMPLGTIILFVVQIGLHLFYQGLLDVGLHLAMPQIQTGNAQNVSNGNAFITSYLCPDMGNIVYCSNLYVNIQKLTFSGSQDFYNATTGTIPMASGSLDLSNFGSGSFCNAGASQFLLLTAIYTGPSVLGGFLPNIFSVSYHGTDVDAVMSQTATYAEAFTVQTATGAAAAC